MRKQLLSSPPDRPLPAGEIDLGAVAKIYYSSEAPSHPVDDMLGGATGYWSSERPNVTEEIVFEFDAPQRITRVMFEAEERNQERTQEIRAEYSIDGGAHYRGLFVQEFNFSPGGATLQREDLRFDLDKVTHLRLFVTPNKQGGGCATLRSLRVFG
jgi:hypothetical protein